MSLNLTTAILGTWEVTERCRVCDVTWSRASVVRQGVAIGENIHLVKAILNGISHAELPGDGTYMADFEFDDDSGAAFTFTVSPVGDVILAPTDDYGSGKTVPDLEVAWDASPGSRDLFVVAARAFDATVRSGGFNPSLDLRHSGG